MLGQVPFVYNFKTLPKNDSELANFSEIPKIVNSLNTSIKAAKEVSTELNVCR